MLSSVLKNFNFREIFRYILSGGSVFAIDFFLYWILAGALNFEPWYANLLATPVVWLYMYLVHKYITFRSTNKPFIESMRFLSLILFNTFAIPFLLYVFVDTIGINYLIAKIIVTGLVVIWNYPIYKFWIYK